MFGQTEARPRVRDLGVEVGVLPTGPLNAITDVAGVKVGQTTLIRGDNIRTGVRRFCRTEGIFIRRGFRGRFSWAMRTGSWRDRRR